MSSHRLWVWVAVQMKWEYCEWIVRVKCLSVFFIMIVWASLNVRNIFEHGDPTFPPGAEVGLSFVVFLCALFDLIGRFMPGKPGAVSAIQHLDEPLCEVIIKRCATPRQTPFDALPSPSMPLLWYHALPCPRPPAHA